MAKLDEITTDQFTRWERRGRGWKVWPQPVAPEPPFRPFIGYRLPPVDPTKDDGRKPTFLASVLDRVHAALNPKPPVIAEPEEEEPEPEVLERSELVELQTLLPANLDIDSDAFADFLAQLAVCREPVTFELLGTPGRIAVQFVSHPADTPSLTRQLDSYFPEVAFLKTENALVDAWVASGPEVAIVEFGLEREFLLPLATGKKLDPFHGIIAAMSQLAKGELALFQVIFEPVENDWRQSAVRTIEDAAGKPVFINRPELTELAEDKFLSPLFGAVVRIATCAADFDRAWQIARELAYSLRLFGRQESNALIPLHNEEYSFDAHEVDVLLRQSRRSGMLLNTDELKGFVHFPSSSVRSPALLRQTKRTKAAPESLTTIKGFILGENHHLGKTVPVGLSPDQRVRHCHVIGTPGSGKSTLLFNLIMQDILAFLESSKGGTLADLQKFLIDPAFRAEFLPTVKDPEVVFYWRKGFVHLSGNKSIGPLLTRLSDFLTPKPIRYMVSQKENRLDFAEIMNSGKIFLAKLPQGMMGAENSSLMGSFLMAKFHLAAMSRQRLPESVRRDFFIYLDEAHEFATPSMAEVLTGARKYRVGMTLAHHFLGQFDNSKDIASALLRSAVAASLGAELASRVSFYLPDQFIEYLEALPQKPVHAPVVMRRGYKVKRVISKLSDAEQTKKENAAIRLIGESMRKK